MPNYTATFIVGRNTFFSIPLTNHDDSINVVEEDAKQLAGALGVHFMYVNQEEPQ